MISAPRPSSPHASPDDDEHRRTTAPIRRLRHFFIFLLLFSAVFWVWAFLNTFRYDYVDGGVVSFSTVMLSSTYVLCVIHHGGRSQCKRRTMLILPISSSLLVTLNYALGSALTEHLWGRVYCGIFTALWFIFALVQFVLIRHVFRVADTASMPRRNDDEAIEQDDASEAEGVDEGAGTIT